LQQETYGQGQQQVDKFFRQGAPIAKEFSQLAQGGLVNRGMQALQPALERPDMAPGIIARDAARYGVLPTAEQTQDLNQQRALAKASSGVRLTNATRTGLVNAERDLRYGG